LAFSTLSEGGDALSSELMSDACAGYCANGVRCRTCDAHRAIRTAGHGQHGEVDRRSRSSNRGSTVAREQSDDGRLGACRQAMRVICGRFEFMAERNAGLRALLRSRRWWLESAMSCVRARQSHGAARRFRELGVLRNE
jgi:hypothetical protein